MPGALYRVLSKLHWSDREREIDRLLHRHWAEGAGFRRLVDVGCGPGWLKATADGLGVSYLGIDPDPPASGACFVRGTAREAASVIGAGDVVVLNGVAHHLDDAEFELVASACRDTAGLVVCDHARDGSTPVLSRALQALDRGRYVRSIGRLASVPGMTSVEIRRFPIRVAGIAVWDYLAVAFRPNRP
jgi:SAM-dependent methyltransferase